MVKGIFALAGRDSSSPSVIYLLFSPRNIFSLLGFERCDTADTPLCREMSPGTFTTLHIPQKGNLEHSGPRDGTSLLRWVLEIVDGSATSVLCIIGKAREGEDQEPQNGLG